ncbi:hypothetical protein GCM10023166_09050 [Paeniglutamicibacter cryotolerans]
MPNTGFNTVKLNGFPSSSNSQMPSVAAAGSIRGGFRGRAAGADILMETQHAHRFGDAPIAYQPGLDPLVAWPGLNGQDRCRYPGNVDKYPGPLQHGRGQPTEGGGNRHGGHVIVSGGQSRISETYKH